MPRKKKEPLESGAARSLPSIAAMKFWSRLKNPPPTLAFAFPEDLKSEIESLDRLLQLPLVPFDDTVVYSLRISLDRSCPEIWRRILVKSVTLDVLHQMIQLSMGWEDVHLHEFEIQTTRVPLVDEGAKIDESGISLVQLHAAKIKKIRYDYDFGDDWQHTIKIEKTLRAKPEADYPQCIAGEGACPIEDCGGIDRWSRLIEALQFPDDEQDLEIEELLDRLGKNYRVPAFDPEKTNKILQRAFQKSRSRKKADPKEIP